VTKLLEARTELAYIRIIASLRNGDLNVARSDSK
jgi:hypothetical protein